MIHRVQPECPRCGKPLQSIRKDMGKNFVGDTFVSWRPCECVPTTPPADKGNVEDAGKEYANSMANSYDVVAHSCFYDGFIAGASWQASNTSVGMKCGCVNVEIGSYDNQIELTPPEYVIDNLKKTGYWAKDCELTTICVDVCIAREVQGLWKKGVVTTGCCCGHNKVPPYISVTSEDVPEMKRLGYAAKPNPMKPGENSFVPKSFHPSLDAGKQDGWIRVEDRLPAEGGRYLCYCESLGNLGTSHFQWNCSYNPLDKSFHDFAYSFQDGERVTHWMHLPESPNRITGR